MMSSTVPSATTLPWCMTTTWRAGLLDLGEQVAGHDHGAPAGRVAAQHLAHRVDLRRVEPVGRLVEHQQLRQAEHGLGDGEPLPHALAVGADAALDRRRRARRSPAPRRCARPRPGGRWPPSTAAGCPRRTGAAGSPGPSTNAPIRASTGAPGLDGLAERGDRARGRPDEPHQHAQHGGLAGAVGAEQAEHHALLDVERDALHRAEPAAVGLGQVADLQRRAPLPGPGAAATRRRRTRRGRPASRAARAPSTTPIPISRPERHRVGRDRLARHDRHGQPRRPASPIRQTAGSGAPA